METDFSGGEMSRAIAVCGGIGSGKSVVCTVLRAMGYDVYDCDSRAKFLMDTDVAIQERISREVCAGAVSDGVIDRKLLSAEVFSSPVSLEALNAIVHGAVVNDFCRWKNKGQRVVFVETAILYTSGLDACVREVWHVLAPDGLRMERVLRRNPDLTAEAVRARIAAQAKDESPDAPHVNVKTIVNDGFTPLLPQIEALLKV